jgi:3',5'-cyclic AMP phosphodiesterase CpdA
MGKERQARGTWSPQRVGCLVLIILVIALGSGLGVLVSAKNSMLGIHDQPKITTLIYPTLGNPAIVKKGNSLTLEFDPRMGEFELPFAEMKDFVVTAKTSNDKTPLEVSLPVLTVNTGASTRWPEYAATPGQDRRIFLVTVAIPRGTPADLYDLSIKARKNRLSFWLKDSQPHALCTVDGFKDDFSFVQMTDIHVWGQEIYYPSCTYQERSRRPDGKDPSRKGAVYFQKAIDQVNTMKPDFAVFSGDYMFGQRYFTQDNGAPWGETTEYEYEMLWFYQEAMRLDVPVFMTIGNHDGYFEGSEAAGEDWFANWRMLFGPLYHSYDYGSYHFLSLNSMDWAAQDRTLTNWFDIILSPTKYKGQVQAGGDAMQPGYSAERLNAIDDSKLTGQLAWMRDDLAAHQDAKMRIVVMHHDPWKLDGSGEMWGAPSAEGGLQKTLKQVMGEVLEMGNGTGRLAAVKLMKEDKVALTISGHDHSDSYGSTPWYSGGGEVKFVNTTSTQFQTETVEKKYPGYRRIFIKNGKVASYNYADPKWSYPFYTGTNVGGETDLSTLHDPAISRTVEPATGNSEQVTVTVRNTLVKPLGAAYVKLLMPDLRSGYYYRVDGGSFGEVYDVGGDKSSSRNYQVYTDVPAGMEKAVTVHQSAAPDTHAPTGSIAINGGTRSTRSALVKLSLPATDTGGSGMWNMMISNSPGFEGAQWVNYASVEPWTLADGGAGVRTVYVKFRDTAMPPNVSAVSKASITYTPPK